MLGLCQALGHLGRLGAGKTQQTLGNTELYHIPPAGRAPQPQNTTGTSLVSDFDANKVPCTGGAQAEPSSVWGQVCHSSGGSFVGTELGGGGEQE